MANKKEAKVLKLTKKELRALRAGRSMAWNWSWYAAASRTEQQLIEKLSDAGVVCKDPQTTSIKRNPPAGAKKRR